MDQSAILASAQACQRVLFPHINPDGSLKPTLIRALLRLRGVAIGEVAKELEVSRQYVDQVIDRKRPDSRIRTYLAASLRMGLDRDQIWGRE